MRRMPHGQSSDGVRGPRSQVNHRDESPRINRRDRACSGVIAFTYASSAAAPVDAAVRVAFGGRSDDDAARLFRGAVRSAASAHAMIAAASDAIPPPASSALAPDDEAPPSPPLPPPPPSSAPLPSAALVAASASRALEAKKTACRDHAEIFAEPGPRARAAGRPLAGIFAEIFAEMAPACARTPERRALSPRGRRRRAGAQARRGRREARGPPPPPGWESIGRVISRVHLGPFTCRLVPARRRARYISQRAGHIPCASRRIHACTTESIAQYISHRAACDPMSRSEPLCNSCHSSGRRHEPENT